MYLTAHSVAVDSDEGQFTLEIATDNGHVTINIHGIDLDTFYDQVKARIGPYLQERDEARRTRPTLAQLRADENAHERMTGQHVFECNPDESGGYEPSDPKHENFHSVHADIWDARAGK